MKSIIRRYTLDMVCTQVFNPVFRDVLKVLRGYEYEYV